MVAVVAARGLCAAGVLVVIWLCAPGYASAGTPATGRLPWGSGPVLHSSAPYLVFWTPSGESIPASSEALMERFFTDVAADSGKSSNVFGVLRQYYDHAGFADYRQRFDPARQVVVDTHPYPPRDTAQCPDVSSTYSTCISDGQIQSELERLITADRLPTAGKPGPELSASAPIYFVLLPADVNACHLFATLCADKTPGGCAYHLAFRDAGNGYVLYAPILTQCHALSAAKNYQADNNVAVQEPNGDSADLLFTPVSHELSETITDPLPSSGWENASTNNEVGDNCYRFGPFPSLSTSGETLTIEESMTLRARTENAGHVGDEHEWSGRR